VLIRSDTTVAEPVPNRSGTTAAELVLSHSGTTAVEPAPNRLPS
jgi:hypothetical protein